MLIDTDSYINVRQYIEVMSVRNGTALNTEKVKAYSAIKEGKLKIRVIAGLTVIHIIELIRPEEMEIIKGSLRK
jgi:hypothetical protein